MKKLKEILGSSFKVVMFIIATILWSIFVYAIGGEWLYFMPLIAGDVLFWETISWQFWKKKKKKPKKKKSEVRSWVDAIGFAVIAATILRTFLIEAYTIPTSSMEKSMLIGDFLFVSKTSYGPRVPMTPIAFPLVHHTMPVVGGKSYSEAIKLPYHRMKGFGTIERNDCVVFNYPAEKLGRPIDKKENYVKRCVGIPGDKIEIIDAQLIVNDAPQEEFEGMKKQWIYEVSIDTSKGRGLNTNSLYEKYDITEGGYGRNRYEYNLTLTNEGRDTLKTFPNVTAIKKRIEKPGDTKKELEKKIKSQKDRKKTFTDKVLDEEMKKLLQEKLKILNKADKEKLKDLLDKLDEQSIYLEKELDRELELFKQLEFEQKIKDLEAVVAIIIIDQKIKGLEAVVAALPYKYIFPHDENLKWNIDNYGPITIPAAGATIEITTENLAIYKDIIERYEENKLEIVEGEIYINDKVATTYTFAMDYYWMMGDNRHNSADSRFWGFVPENHIVGKALFVWMSWDTRGKWFNKIRWNRLFRSVK